MNYLKNFSLYLTKAAALMKISRMIISLALIVVFPFLAHAINPPEVSHEISTIDQGSYPNGISVPVGASLPVGTGTWHCSWLNSNWATSGVPFIITSTAGLLTNVITWSGCCTASPAVSASCQAISIITVVELDSISPVSQAVGIDTETEFQIETYPSGKYGMVSVTVSGATILNAYDPTTGKIKVKFDQASATVSDYKTVTATCGTSSKVAQTIVVKVDLEPESAGCTPDLVPGRICINAQPAYNKAKWKAIIVPTGSATVTQVSGGITVLGGSGLSDGDTFWVEGGGAIGDYKMKITHDSVGSCSMEKGEMVFKFEQDETTYFPRSVTEDFVIRGDSSTGIYTTNSMPGYWSDDLRNINNCTDSKVDYENISHLFPWPSIYQNAEFTVKTSGKFGVRVNPVGLYAGEVKAVTICSWSGEVHSEVGATASYTMNFKMDGVPLVKPKKARMADSFGATWPLEENGDSDGVVIKYTAGAADGSFSSSGSHGCAQREAFGPEQDTKVVGSFVLSMSDFIIVP